MPLRQPESISLPPGSANTVAAWIMHLGFETYIAYLRSVCSMAPQQPGPVAMPFGAGPIQQPYYGAPMMPQAMPFAQYPAEPAWADQQAFPPELPSAIYNGLHFNDLQKRNFDIVRNMQARELCSTIPPLLPPPAVNERVMKIKAEEYALRRPDHETRQAINIRLINLGRGLYRQYLVDQLAQRDAGNRADPNVDARSLSIAYQAYLAVRLDLPGPIQDLQRRLDEGTMRGDIFEGIIPWASVAEVVDHICEEVRVKEIADPEEEVFKAFLQKQEFWQAHLVPENLYLRNALFTNLSS